jgi:hypothetical protein
MHLVCYLYEVSKILVITVTSNRNFVVKYLCPSPVSSPVLVYSKAQHERQAV